MFMGINVWVLYIVKVIAKNQNQQWMYVYNTFARIQGHNFAFKIKNLTE